MYRAMKLQRDQITSAIKAELEGRSEILFAYLFGSFVESPAFQDVDVAIYVTDQGTVKDGMMYSIQLSVALERKIGCPVDVILLNASPDHLVHQISKGQVIVNKDDDVRTDFITAAWSRYFDIQPKRLQALRDIVS